jgi:hypothetical protein
MGMIIDLTRASMYPYAICYAQVDAQSWTNTNIVNQLQSHIQSCAQISKHTYMSFYVNTEKLWHNRIPTWRAFVPAPEQMYAYGFIPNITALSSCPPAEQQQKAVYSLAVQICLHQEQQLQEAVLELANSQAPLGWDHTIQLQMHLPIGMGWWGQTVECQECSEFLINALWSQIFPREEHH